MKIKISLWVIVTLLSVAVVGAGDIQVSCEPGIRVFLDGKFVGTTSAREDGLAILNVKNGRHELRLEKAAFVAQTFEVDVLALPIEVVPEEFEPLPPQEEERPTPRPEVKPRGVGSLIVTSAPQNCVVTVDGVSETKKAPHLSFGGLAEGEHTITFAKEGFETISGVINVRPGTQVTVRGNLKEGKVETLHRGKGSLRLVSRPVQCTIHFRGEVIDKTRQRVNRSLVPAGRYPIVIEWRGMKVQREILINDGRRTLVNVDFMNRTEPITTDSEPE